ncbi:MAG: DUF3879 family protein [Lachnospiraceae bacterium]|nr:DUF3879 family protein [Lachnospiraceae bacterium]
MIRHELAHIRRCDQVWKPLYFIVLSFYWYNPFVWIAFLMFSTDMELACDEAVAGVYDEELRKRYVQTLLSVAGNNKGMGLLTLPFGKAPIVYRIKEIVNYKKKGATGRFFGVLVILIMTLVFSTVRVSAGFDPAEITDYSLVIPLADEESGERYLLVPYSRDPNAYELLFLDESLETEVRENSDEFWYERPLSDYTIRQNEATGLEYIVKNQHAVWEGHVLLRNERDARKYDALAGDYAELFKEIIPERDIGYIYADYEVKGLGGRLGLTSEEYMRLERQLSENGTPTFDASDFNAWKPLLDELEIEYDFALDPESARYRGAVEWLAKMIGDSWAEGMSEEQKEEQIRYTIKSFDEDGDEVPFMSVPGMLITDENEADRRTIIPIPEAIRQMMFDLNKEEFLKWNGMSVDTERSSVYRAYQEQVPKKDRLKGTWTLGQYERIYNRYFAEAVKESDPGWQAGEDFNPAVLASITREEIEQYISSDGVEFILQKD